MTSTVSRSNRAPSGGSNKAPWIIAAAVGVVVVIAAIIAVIIAGGSSGTDVEQTRDVQVRGAALPPDLGAGTTDVAIGVAAPGLSGSSFDGSSARVRVGEPTLVVFFTHWCPACQAEVPKLVDWFESGEVPDGLSVVGVSTGVDRAAPNYPPSEWLEREQWPFPVIVDDGDSSAARAWGLTSYPYFVVIDEDGRVVARGSGGRSIAELEQLIEPALS